MATFTVSISKYLQSLTTFSALNGTITSPILVSNFPSLLAVLVEYPLQQTTYLFHEGVLYYIYQIDNEPIKEIALCDNVSAFTVTVSQANGKEKIDVLLRINNNQYKTAYTLE